VRTPLWAAELSQPSCNRATRSDPSLAVFQGQAHSFRPPRGLRLINMADDEASDSGYDTAAQTPRPIRTKSSRSRRFFGGDDGASTGGSRVGDDGEFKGGDSATPGDSGKKKKKPARMRRFTQAAMPEVRRG